MGFHTYVVIGSVLQAPDEWASILKNPARGTSSHAAVLRRMAFQDLSTIARPELALQDSSYETRRIKMPTSSCILALEKMRGWLSSRSEVLEGVYFDERIFEVGHK